ncbi:Rap1a/Tai family immunity protein [Pseudooceanicola spongiae]|uniref:Rap1a immunity protein domain-containing protein n=1 Tax=Pseudooceanicola spongiae TaxID=2613965 RepID=A0A7L9WKN1_9RHOB|nr:Rap1a/Tai family immunity protein [Pseudooceanicola spongiae]QOL80453.1 hypothetical protein F3W81_06285 [Pseudooceanicola spongiae]
MKALASILAFIIPGSSQALDFVSVQDVLPFCDEVLADHWSGNSGMCLGMMIGVGEIGTLNCGGNDNGFDSIPSLSNNARVSHFARVQTFVNWARDHPEKWDSPASVGMAIAMSEKFPCE